MYTGRPNPSVLVKHHRAVQWHLCDLQYTVDAVSIIPWCHGAVLPGCRTEIKRPICCFKPASSSSWGATRWSQPCRAATSCPSSALLPCCPAEGVGCTKTSAELSGPCCVCNLQQHKSNSKQVKEDIAAANCYSVLAGSG